MSAAGKGKGKAASGTLKEIKIGAETYKCEQNLSIWGDTVLARSPGPLPYVGVIRELGRQKLLLAWFYRPEEAMGGRKEFHGEKELFKSDHLDTVPVATITKKCVVHSMKAYQNLKTVKPDDYYSRFTYVPETHEFRPDRVPVFCSCEMPYNPDKFMVECETCQDWFHPECQKYSTKEVSKMDNFVCRTCSEGQPAAQSPVAAAPANKKAAARKAAAAPAAAPASKRARNND